MSASLIEKAKRLLEGLEVGHFETAKDWNSDDYEDYFLYFGDADPEVRKLSILVFASALGNTRRGVARVLQPRSHERFRYAFDDYAEAFLVHKEAISRDFPILYRTIVCEMKKWHEETPLSVAFIDVEPRLIDDLLALADEAVVDCAELTFKDLLEEMKWKDRNQGVDEVE
ncbi:hypothetical protein [Planococcus lenghuensis]|uniref:Uncharacterized protein n=1 Tax=Planococcus lenghuensis TaxID=2213202 RepID=A0A1Q2KXG2_9BACL|nr:hypothetical protein [Planococcus lenghuensis]AQQ52880.1 hypothetical protein B0X71_07110 [Planococcus lenghuensis]